MTKELNKIYIVSDDSDDEISHTIGYYSTYELAKEAIMKHKDNPDNIAYYGDGDGDIIQFNIYEQGLDCYNTDHCKKVFSIEFYIGDFDEEKKKFQFTYEITKEIKNDN